MKSFLLAALLVVLAEMALAHRPGRGPAGPPATSSEEGGTCLDHSGEERDLGETWTEDGGRRSCKCVTYDYGLFSVPNGMDKTPKRWCNLEGCMSGDTFVAPGENKDGCHCIPGTHPRMQDASTKYHCKP